MNARLQIKVKGIILAILAFLVLGVWVSKQIGDKWDEKRDTAKVIAEFHVVNADIKIYPNPTKGTVYTDTTSVIKIYNIQGAFLEETFGNQVDLSPYSQGIYLLQINGKWGKVIKN